MPHWHVTVAYQSRLEGLAMFLIEDQFWAIADAFVPRAWCLVILPSGRKDANGRSPVPAKPETRLDLNNQAEAGAF